MGAPVRPVLPGERDDLVVVCGTTPWDGNRFCDQHVAEQLARFAPVLYVEPPVSPVEARREPAAAARRARRGPVLVHPGLARVTPAAPPGKERPGVKALTVELTRVAMSHTVRRLGAEIVEYPVGPEDAVAVRPGGGARLI